MNLDPDLSRHPPTDCRGDDQYEQPYFYVKPWPHVSADALPTLPPVAHWHTDGFVGAIATAERAVSGHGVRGRNRIAREVKRRSWDSCRSSLIVLGDADLVPVLASIE